MHKWLLVAVLFGTSLTNSIGFAEDLTGRKHFSEVLFEATFVIEGSMGGFGTGFAIGCDDNTAYLVTARHVLDSMLGDTAVVYYRVRLQDGNYRNLPHKIPIRSNGRKLYTVHENPTVDAAVLRMSIPEDSLLKVQLTPIHRSVLAAENDMKKYWLHPGDEVFFLGYPLGTASPRGVFPILRSGFVSSYPFIPLLDNPFVYLDGPVFEGNSGGPVYFEMVASSWNGRAVNQEARIIGLVSFGLCPEASRKADPGKKRHDIQVAGFVNSAYILQMLDSVGCQ